MKKYILPILALLCIATGFNVVLVVTDGDDGRLEVQTEKEAIVPQVIAVDSTGDGEPDKPIELDSEARKIVENAAETPERFDLSGDLRGEDNTPVAQLDAPLASPHWPGCETRFLPTNWSNRTASVRAVALHYTVSANRPGKSDMDGLTAYASSRKAGVSWHFLIDAEGHCYYSVPVSKKAWTIGNLNSQTVNIEVIATGKEKTFPAESRGARKLGQVVRRIGRVFNIPMRLGAVSNCKVTKTGVITHWQGGACAGGHHDIRPYSIKKVVQEIALGVLTPGERAAAQCLIREREHLKRSNASIHRQKYNECRKRLGRRNRELHALARRDGWDKNQRRERHKIIHDIL